MAWRPTRYLIEGELDNTVLGKLTGEIRFVGMRRKVTFNLQGDFHRDIRGAKIRLRGEGNGADKDEARSFFKRFSPKQTGKVGDITTGQAPSDYALGYCYVEWYSDPSSTVLGRVDLRGGGENAVFRAK